MSGGWENPHYVDAVQAGTRFAIPAFFHTLEHSDTPQPWADDDEVGRARVLFECGIFPSSCEDFLNFQKRYWGRLLSP